MLVHLPHTVLQQEAKEEPVYSTLYGCIQDERLVSTLVTSQEVGLRFEREPTSVNW